MSRCRLPPATLAATFAALLLAGLLSGCGASHHAPASGALHVSVNEWRVTPEHADAKPGALLIVVHNAGRLAHNLVLAQDGVHIMSTPAIMPGASADLETIVAPGTYELLSSLVDDLDTGVHGTLKVG